MQGEQATADAKEEGEVEEDAFDEGGVAHFVSYLLVRWRVVSL
jgi:hypothetical protein